MQIDSNGLQILHRDECLRLLGKATLGRVAVTASALPCILPITFKVIGDQSLFRTSPGTKLDASTRNTVVAFEVDEFDATAHTGWSVIVTGVASEITNPGQLEAARRLELPRWAPSAGDRIVAVPIELVSGRRIVPPCPDAGTFGPGPAATAAGTIQTCLPSTRQATAAGQGRPITNAPRPRRRLISSWRRPRRCGCSAH